MTISDRIRQQAVAEHEVTGRPPSPVYLSAPDWEELIAGIRGALRAALAADGHEYTSDPTEIELTTPAGPVTVRPRAGQPN